MLLLDMESSPASSTNQIVLFGHDPVIVRDRCAALQVAGFSPIIAATRNDAELLIQRSALVFVGSWCAPITRERLAAVARSYNVPVLNIGYSRSTPSPPGVVDVDKAVTADQLVEAVARAVSKN